MLTNEKYTHQRIKTRLKNIIYYLKGMGDYLDSGFGQEIYSKGLDVTSSEIGQFRQLRFQGQVDTVVSDLQSSFWETNARYNVNLFGAYFFLH